MLDETCTQVDFGLLVGIGQPAVSDLLSRGIIKPGQTAGQWLLDYTSHLREQAAGRGMDGELAYQRSELARVNRERAEIKLALERKEYAPVQLLEQVLATVGRSIAGALEPLHSSLAKRCPALTPEDLRHIQTEVSKACDLAVTASLDVLDAQQEGDDTEPSDMEDEQE
jgi:phage terminase Nu1 subunit (DNA packaging protein)|nr:MAG TPA_asm: DNA packaging protein [Bacteriophage sp.]